MATMAHCAFHDRVSVELQQFAGARVIEAREDSGPKSTPSVGNTKHDLGRAKTSCSKCLDRFDKDFNGTIYIVLEHFTNTQWQV